MTLPLLTRKPYRDPPGQVLAGDLRLPLARVHEFCGPARRTLALIAARQMQGPVFWIASHWQGDSLLGDGVQGYIDPGRITFVRPKRVEDILWAAEECLRAGCVPLVVAPIILFGRRVRGLSRRSQDSIADVGVYVGEVLGQIKTVQAYNHQALDKIRFKEVVEQAFRVAKLRTVQRGLLITIVITLVLGAVGMMLWVGGLDVIAGRISAGELAAFVFYSVIVGTAVGSVSEVIGELQRAAGAAERILELLAARNEIAAPTQHKHW